MKATVVLVALLALAGCSAGMSSPSPLAGTSPAITAADLRTRLFLIADDSMMGRESGSEGAYKTADYVASEFRRLGLEPAGENGTYFQAVPFWNAIPDPRSHIEVDGAPLAMGRDFLPSNLAAMPREFAAAPAIYGGTVSDTLHWISAEQARGKLVVLGLAPGTSLRGARIFSPRWRDACDFVDIDVQTGSCGTSHGARSTEHGAR